MINDSIHDAEEERSSHSVSPSKDLLRVDWGFTEVILPKARMSCLEITVEIGCFARLRASPLALERGFLRSQKQEHEDLKRRRAWAQVSKFREHVKQLCTYFLVIAVAVKLHAFVRVAHLVGISNAEESLVCVAVGICMCAVELDAVANASNVSVTLIISDLVLG